MADTPIKSVSDILVLDAGSALVSIELHNIVASGPGQFTGPPEFVFAVFKRTINPQGQWETLSNDQPLGTPLLLDNAQEMTRHEYRAVILLGRLGSAPNPYDMSVVFRDQNSQLKLKTLGDRYGIKGQLSDQSAGFKLSITCQ